MTAGQHEWGAWEGCPRCDRRPLPPLRQPGRRCAKCGSDGQLAAARYRVLGMATGSCDLPLYLFISSGCGWHTGGGGENQIPLTCVWIGHGCCIITPDAIEMLVMRRAVSCSRVGAGVMSGAVVCASVPGDHFGPALIDACISSSIELNCCRDQHEENSMRANHTV